MEFIIDLIHKLSQICTPLPSNVAVSPSDILNHYIVNNGPGPVGNAVELPVLVTRNAILLFKQLQMGYIFSKI